MYRVYLLEKFWSWGGGRGTLYIVGWEVYRWDSETLTLYQTMFS